MAGPPRPCEVARTQRPGGRGPAARCWLGLALLVLLASCPGATAQPQWLSAFRTRNGVAADASGAVVLAGNTSSSSSLAPSAGLISVNAYDGNFQLNVTLSDWQILQSGYQAQVSLFMAPLNYSLADYLTWPDTYVVDGQQLAFVRSKIYTTAIPDYTWSTLAVPSAAATKQVGVSGAWRNQGTISISRTGSTVSGFLQVNPGSPVSFGTLPAPSTGPVLLGVQVLFGYTYNVTLKGLSLVADRTVPPPSPSPAPAPPPAPPSWSSNTSSASWLSWFGARNNVTFDPATGAATLAGYTANSNLAPSAGMLSSLAFVGDFEMNATVTDYKILQSGYQASFALFVAPATYSLADYLTWPDTYAVDAQQLAYARAKIYTTDIPNYTWTYLYNGTTGKEAGSAGNWSNTGVFSISRKGTTVSGFLKVGSNAAVSLGSLTLASTEPVRLGLQMLFGFRYSVTISKLSIFYNRTMSLAEAIPSPSPAPPSPSPAPLPPSPSPAPLPPSWSSNTSSASWLSWFGARNNVTFDPATGAATLAGFTNDPTQLAPAPGLLSLSAFDSDVSLTAKVSAYAVLQSGYQAEIGLFLSRTDYRLRDLRSWPDCDAVTSKQSAWVRAKIFDGIPSVTYGSLRSSASTTTKSVIAQGGWMTQGVMTIARQGGNVTASLQVGSNPPVPFGQLPVDAGQVLIGLQLLYCFNCSVTLSNITVTYANGSKVVPALPPPSSPAPPPPPPPPVPPPACAASPVAPDEVPVYKTARGSFYPKGVGGGGAMSAFSMSPYTDLWLVGTDMGSLYRSPNRGKTWEMIDHKQIRMTTELPFVGPVGFSADGQTLFFAPCWSKATTPCVIKRSTDAGMTWTAMEVNAGGVHTYNQAKLPFNNARPVRYWACSTTQAELCFAATVGGLDRTADKGLTWAPVADARLSGLDSRGTFLDVSTSPATVYHATPNGIYAWPDGQLSALRTVVSGGVGSFAAGRDDAGLTLTYIDTDAAFCAQAMASVAWSNAERRNATLSTCGRMWVSVDGGASFAPTTHYATKVKMADNNGRVVYSVPDRSWDRNYGVRVFKSIVAAPAAGNSSAAVTTTKVLDQVNEDAGWAVWPADKLERSAVGLDVGYWDGGYYLFSVNQLNASEAGGSENFFLHVTRDGGATWQAPFTRFRDCDGRGAGKRWSSTGLEPTSMYHVAVHPTAPSIIYAGAADIRGMVSDDGGESWRLLNRAAAPNSIYGFAFDPNITGRVFVAGAKWHDWPHEWYANPLNGNGGIFVSDDLGRSFTRVGGASSRQCLDAADAATLAAASTAVEFLPCTDMVNDFLSVAYDPVGRYVYAGGHINGIARIKLYEEDAWTWINDGITGDDCWQNETIIPKIQVDLDNGDVYALLTGNRALGSPRNMLNQPRTGIYRMRRGGSSWTLLRGQVLQPAGVTDKPWQYVTGFAIDWTQGTPGNRTHMLLSDMINNLQAPGTAGAWRTTDGGATWRFTQQSDWASDVVFGATPGRAYLLGSRSAGPWGASDVPGSWGYGGLFYSDDGGATWTPDDNHPMVEGVGGVAVDGSDPCRLFYATGGAGLMLGPAPPGLPGCSASG